jgi:hypothetical protein
MGDYSAAGWAGAAPNGGGNIDNKNIVPVLEGIKLAMPDADITYMVGTGITSGDRPFYACVQRHSLSTTGVFTPSQPTNPYEAGYGEQLFAASALPTGTQGLKATYFKSKDLTGDVAFTRLGE